VGFFYSLNTGGIAMGLDRTIRFPSTETPNWEAIQEQIVRAGITAVLRMIDGLPAFPDEVPEAGWKELRLGFSSGMVTIRRGEGVFTCAIWGNADEQLQFAWSQVIWACANAGSGTIDLPNGRLSPDEFAQACGFKVLN
jgi:hypothetical protein